MDIVEETKKKVLEFGYKKVRLFASESTTKSKLYEERFVKSKIKVISPDDKQQKVLNMVIRHVMGESKN